MSSAWALGYTVMLGLGVQGKTIENLRRERECVIKIPSSNLWHNVERLAPLTGSDPVPAAKADKFRYEPRSSRRLVSRRRLRRWLFRRGCASVHCSSRRP